MDEQEMKRRAQYDYEHRHDNDLQGAQTSGFYANAVPMEPVCQNELQAQNDIIANIMPRFDYHGPNSIQIPKYQNLRDAAKAFATVIVRNCPVYAQETQSALQAVETALMLANKSIALNDRS